MHIETRRQEKRKKYYLAYSYRENGKAKKIRVYLGADLSKRQLNAAIEGGKRELERRILASRSSRDPYKTVLSRGEVKELETLQPTGEIKLLHLSEAEWVKFTEAFTYNTNAIEGSTVTEEEVIGILEKNKWPDRTKEEISETYGLAEAVKYVRKTKEHVSLELIKKLHEIVFKNSKSFAGKFRQRGEEVVVGDQFGNVVHRGAPSMQVPYLLKKLVKWYSKNKKRYSPLVLAAVVHNQFENIHPFRDG
ncbi:MAG: Fic family protein, partial [Candidatus Micrarchaeota archaeon]|nr:Fic family protein [Candidatus Micrarchaeota archaeon]